MISEHRRSEIEKYVIAEGKASILELAEKFDVSDETIRRDLAVIADGKLIKKVHGGAIAVLQPVKEAEYSARLTKNYESKKKIGQYAAKLISDNDIIGIDFGAATEGFAEAVFGVSNVKIVTNSFPVANILMSKIERGDFTGEIIILGGTLDPYNKNVRGVITTCMLNKFRFNKVFIGVTAVSDESVTDFVCDEAAFSEAMIQRSAHSYVLAESDKFAKNSVYEVCDVSNIDKVITDNRVEINSKIIKAFEDAGTELVIVDVNEE